MSPTQSAKYPEILETPVKVEQSGEHYLYYTNSACEVSGSWRLPFVPNSRTRTGNSSVSGKDFICESLILPLQTI